MYNDVRVPRKRFGQCDTFCSLRRAERELRNVESLVMAKGPLVFLVERPSWTILLPHAIVASCRVGGSSLVIFSDSWISEAEEGIFFFYRGVLFFRR